MSKTPPARVRALRWLFRAIHPQPRLLGGKRSFPTAQPWLCTHTRYSCERCRRHRSRSFSSDSEWNEEQSQETRGFRGMSTIILAPQQLQISNQINQIGWTAAATRNQTSLGQTSCDTRLAALVHHLRIACTKPQAYAQCSDAQPDTLAPHLNGCTWSNALCTCETNSFYRKLHWHCTNTMGDYLKYSIFDTFILWRYWLSI